MLAILKNNNLYPMRGIPPPWQTSKLNIFGYRPARAKIFFALESLRAKVNVPLQRFHNSNPENREKPVFVVFSWFWPDLTVQMVEIVKCK